MSRESMRRFPAGRVIYDKHLTLAGDADPLILNVSSSRDYEFIVTPDLVSIPDTLINVAPNGVTTGDYSAIDIGSIGAGTSYAYLVLFRCSGYSRSATGKLWRRQNGFSQWEQRSPNPTLKLATGFTSTDYTSLLVSVSQNFNLSPFHITVIEYE